MSSDAAYHRRYRAEHKEQIRIIRHRHYLKEYEPVHQRRPRNKYCDFYEGGLVLSKENYSEMLKQYGFDSAEDVQLTYQRIKTAA
jgi:hypothetical protein